MDVKDGASDVIKTDAGDSIKESVFVNVLSDSRSYLTPQSLFPVSGSLTEASGEFFGLSEGNFIPKATYKNSLWKSVLNKSVTFNLNSSFGAIFNEKKKSTLPTSSFWGSCQGSKQRVLESMAAQTFSVAQLTTNSALHFY